MSRNIFPEYKPGLFCFFYWSKRLKIPFQIFSSSCWHAWFFSLTSCSPNTRPVRASSPSRRLCARVRALPQWDTLQLQRNVTFSPGNSNHRRCRCPQERARAGHADAVAAAAAAAAIPASLPIVGPGRWWNGGCRPAAARWAPCCSGRCWTCDCCSSWSGS